MASWTFITNHGAVLVLIGQHKQITAREIAKQIDITERSVRRIISDLEREGYISKERNGRINTYRVNERQTLRRRETGEVSVGELLKTLMA